MTDIPRTVRARSNATWTPEEEELLKRRHEAGRNLFELARLHGREPQAIALKLKKFLPKSR